MAHTGTLGKPIQADKIQSSPNTGPDTSPDIRPDILFFPHPQAHFLSRRHNFYTADTIFIPRTPPTRRHNFYPADIIFVPQT